jgi:hypothetical protein
MAENLVSVLLSILSFFQCFFFYPGSEFFHSGSRIRIKEFKYFNTKNDF